MSKQLFIEKLIILQDEIREFIVKQLDQNNNINLGVIVDEEDVNGLPKIDIIVNNTNYTYFIKDLVKESSGDHDSYYAIGVLPETLDEYVFDILDEIDLYSLADIADHLKTYNSCIY